MDFVGQAYPGPETIAPAPQPRSLTIYILVTQRPRLVLSSLDPTGGTSVRSAHLTLAEAQRSPRTFMSSRGLSDVSFEYFHTDAGQDGYRPRSVVAEQVCAWVEEVMLEMAMPRPRAGWEVTEEMRREGGGGLGSQDPYGAAGFRYS